MLTFAGDNLSPNKGKDQVGLIWNDMTKNDNRVVILIRKCLLLLTNSFHICNKTVYTRDMLWYRYIDPNGPTMKCG